MQATAPAASYIIIDGFNIVGNAQSITADQAQSAVNFNNSTNGNCIGAGALSNHVIVRKNTISWCPGNGIIASGDYVYIYQNVIHHNSFWSPLDTSGITVSGKDSDSYTGIKVLVYSNILYANQNFICNQFQTTPCRITDGEGIIVDSNVDAAFGGRVRIYNNVSYNNGGPGIEVYRSQHVDVMNNTTYMNNVSASAPAPYTAHTAGGEIAISQSNDVIIANNVIYGTAGVPVIYGGITSVTKLYWDYNLMFNGDGSKAMGAHDLIVDPLFVGSASFDFHLDGSSPALGNGTPAFSPDHDIEFNPRPRGSASRGAYQY